MEKSETALILVHSSSSSSESEHEPEAAEEIELKQLEFESRPLHTSSTTTPNAPIISVSILFLF
jgi:hypothetical protein